MNDLDDPHLLILTLILPLLPLLLLSALLSLQSGLLHPRGDLPQRVRITGKESCHRRTARMRANSQPECTVLDLDLLLDLTDLRLA